MAIIRSTIRVGQKPPEEVMQRIREASRHPIVYTEDCPELTEEQLAEFRPVHFVTWEERAQAMQKAGITDLEEKQEEASPCLVVG